MKTKEIIECLKVLKECAETISLPETNCGYGTLLTDVNTVSFVWVLDEAIEKLQKKSCKRKKECL